MSNTFEIIGKIKLGKETEKFRPIETKTSPKGWVGTRLKFNAVNTTGFHMIEAFEGYMNDNSTICYVLGKDKGADGKFPKMQIKWLERNKPEIVEQVASFSKYKIELKDEKFEYLAGIDFVNKLIQILQNKVYENTRFLIEGDVEFNEWNGKVYKKLVPKSVVEITDEQLLDRTFIKYDFYYGPDSVDDTMFEDTGKYLINGWVRQYDGTIKREVPFKEQLIIDTSKAQDDKQKRAFDIIKKRFVVEDGIYKLGVKCVQINGTEKKEITMDDLSDEEKELIEVGLSTLEDFQKEYGSTNGDTIRETKIVSFNRGYNKGAQKTDFTIEDFISQDVTDELMMDDEISYEDEEDDLPF